MEVWEYEYEKRRKARPVDFEEDPSDWSGFASIIEDRNKLIGMLWENQVPGSRAPESLYLEMVQAWSNRGYDVSEAEELVWEGLEALKEKDYRRLEVISARVRQALRQAPKDSDHPYWQFNNPVTWEEIKASFPSLNKDSSNGSAHVNGNNQKDDIDHQLDLPEINLSDDELRRRIESGWLGQIAGGAYGTALEGYTGEVLREVYGDRLDYYVKEPETYNDDITFQIVFLRALEEVDAAAGNAPEAGKSGINASLTSADIADQWLELIPFGWSAEYIALENLRRGIYPPESGSFDNFFSEWIGAQMRGMVCGFIAPGKPLEAARYAYLDGIVSHEKNGVYGEIHSAVLTSLAFIYDDTREILEKSREFIPEGSQFVHYFDLALEAAREVSRKGDNHLAAWQAMEDELKRYNWIHIYPNMVAVVNSLWYCENDFGRAMRILADCGMDVDCNAGEVGSVIGVMNPGTLDEKWTKPFNNRLQTYLPGFEEIKISDLAEWTFSLARR